MPIGRGFPTRKPPSRSPGEVDMGEVNLHLIPTNQNITDTYGTHCASPSERLGEREEREGGREREREREEEREEERSVHVVE